MSIMHAIGHLYNHAIGGVRRPVNHAAGDWMCCKCERGTNSRSSTTCENSECGHTFCRWVFLSNMSDY